MPFLCRRTLVLHHLRDCVLMLYLVWWDIDALSCFWEHFNRIVSGGTSVLDFIRWDINALCFQAEHQCIIMFWWDIDVLSSGTSVLFLLECDIDAPVCFQGQRVTGAMEDCQNQQPVKQLTPLRCGAQCHRYQLSLTMNLQVTWLLQRFCSVNSVLQRLPPTRNL